MTYQPLATITPNRQIAHKAGQFVHINWDGNEFHLVRSGFSQFARVLEYGLHHLYAEISQYSVVQVDDEYRDVWIKDTCLSLTRSEYRALLDATLRTETRLHGFRPLDQQHIPVVTQPTTFYAIPSTVEFHWN